MSRIRKLTPTILKRIIKEEKSKLVKENSNKNDSKKVTNTEQQIDAITQLALQEAKHLLKIKKLREKRILLKRLIAKKSK